MVINVAFRNVHAMVDTEMQYIILSAQITMNILHFLKMLLW